MRHRRRYDWRRSVIKNALNWFHSQIRNFRENDIHPEQAFTSKFSCAKDHWHLNTIFFLAKNRSFNFSKKRSIYFSLPISRYNHICIVKSHYYNKKLCSLYFSLRLEALLISEYIHDLLIFL